ncbi:hypothetical protein BGZ83_010699 [Gryganskiella cystojenkinii]|nr:hypothetical protein BGZ83_010699 [Gryganskiella cystojenkinii]
MPPKRPHPASATKAAAAAVAAQHTDAMEKFRHYQAMFRDPDDVGKLTESTVLTEEREKEAAFALDVSGPGSKRYTGLQLHETGTNQRRIYLAVRFLVDRLRDYLYGETVVDESISLSRNGKFFADLAKELEEKEPSLKGVTPLALSSLFSKVCSEYFDYNKLAIVETGEVSAKSRLLDLAQELHNLELDFLQLKEKKSELTAEEKKRKEDATKSRRSEATRVMMSTRKTRSGGPINRQQQAIDLTVNRGVDPDAAGREGARLGSTDLTADELMVAEEDSLDVMGEADEDMGFGTLEPLPPPLAPMMPSPEPPVRRDPKTPYQYQDRVVVFDVRAAQVAASASLSPLSTPSTPPLPTVKAHKPRTSSTRSQHSTNSTVDIGTGPDLTGLRLNFQRITDAFEHSQQSTEKSVEDINVRLSKLEAGFSPACEARLSQLHGQTMAALQGLFSDMQGLRSFVNNMHVEVKNIENLIKTIKRDVRNLRSDVDELGEINNVNNGNNNSNIPPFRPPSSMNHSVFNPGHQGPYWPRNNPF